MEDLGARKVGICLSSGYFGFFAHTGFVTAMCEMGVSPLALTGSSAGALVAGLWAAGMGPDGIREAVLEIGITDLIDLPRPWEMVGRPGGLLRGRRMEKGLARLMPVETFEQCRIPLAVTVYDLDDRCLRVIDTGPLAPAIRASCSMPGMFGPAPVDGHACWDGGVVEKVPLGPLASRPDLDTIVVCYLVQPRPPGPPRSLAGGLRSAIHSLMYPAQQRAADEVRRGGTEVIVVAPEVEHSGPARLSKGPLIIEKAIEETRRIFDQGDFGCAELS